MRPHDNRAKRPLSTALPRCGAVAALRPLVSSCTVTHTSVPVCLSTGLDLCGYLNAEGLVPPGIPRINPIRRQILSAASGYQINGIIPQFSLSVYLFIGNCKKFVPGTGGS